ncbi:uncharacterized protein rab11fip1b isoform X2 [Brachyhypopomus gauderio]|uniref:uncharacterized protein rab11fip1b isoform X2 n=1 Tax=Brachyhypopomus gauderio TaxID=698409 RepID=UPI004040F37B
MSLADQSQQWFPTSVQVTALQARGLRIKGKNGTNDAYAIMQVAKDKFSTSVVEKCVAPVWEEEATFDLPLFHGDAKERSTLHVYVMHRALVGPDKVLGQALINLPELHENKARDKTEWFKLLNKTGKADKDRGEVLLDIQFMKNNMTASMFDLSSQGKPRSRMGKLKDKLRGKKKEGLSDSASAIVPASQGMMDSEGEEEEAPAEVAAPAKAKKNALKSLFGTHSNLQRNTSQSMSTLSSLPERDSTLSSSVGSGLDLEAPEGKKKKFKFLTHKRTGSSDANPTQSAAGHNPPVTICINGSHVYSEESEPRSIAGSSGHGSTEDLHRTGSGAGVDPNPFTHRRQAEEQREREEKERLRRSQEERDQMEEERRRKVAEEEEEREKEERKRKEEEQKKKIEEEKERMKMEKEKEEKRRKVEEEKEKIRIEKEKEEKRRKVEEEKEKIRIEKEKEEKRRKIEEEKEKIRIEREKEEKRREIEEEKDKIRIEKEKEQRRKAEEEEKERKRLEQEERRKIAEEKMKREEEERMKLEEEERKSAEEERERARLREEEYTRVERKRKEDEERMKKEQEEEQNRLEAERLRKEEQRKTEMERRLAEEKKVKEVEEKEKRRREEEKRAREEEERMKVERKREEEDKRIHEEHRKANERLRLEEERMQKERQARDEQKLAELKRLEERERECKEGSEAEQESRPVPRTRTGNLGSRVRAGGPHVQNPFEAMTSSTNPFEDDDPSTNPFEDALSLEDSSANLFEEPPTTSQPGGLVRSARVTAVKPRPHAVKPLNAADRQTDRREAPELQATGSAVLSQPKKVSEALGPYAQLTHGELAAIVASQQEQLSRRDARIQELEQYIDNLLVRVMEEKPSILMAMASHKKVV